MALLPAIGAWWAFWRREPGRLARDRTAQRADNFAQRPPYPRLTDALVQLLTIIYYLPTRDCDYEDLGPGYSTSVPVNKSIVD